MKKFFNIIILIVIIAAFFNLPCAAASDLDNSLNSLTNQIVTSMTQNNRTRIAIVEFFDLKGNITELGKFIAEELTTRLFMTKKFEVVERELIVQVLNEHKLNLSGLIEPSSAKELGKLLGVNAIVTGTITDLGKTVKLNSRLIATETGAIFAVAAVEIVKDEGIQNLLNQVLITPKADYATVIPANTPPSVSTPTPVPVITSAGVTFALEPILYTDNGHYYQIIEIPAKITWDDAQNQAESITYKGVKGHLATFTTDAEKNFVIKKMGSTIDPEGYWLGGYQPQSVLPVNGWKWVTGERWDYSRWSKGEPNTPDYSQKYGLQIYSSNGAWRSALCDTPAPGFILEFDPPIIYLSDLEWVSATNGYGPVELDITNGGDDSGDGDKIKLGETIYQKGLGVHSYSKILYNLDGKYSRFLSDVGLEGEYKGTVVFEVWVDGIMVYTSKVMTTQQSKKVEVDVTGKKELLLVVTDAGDGNSRDYAVWAGACLTTTKE